MVMNNMDFNNSEFENNLKNKMDELASSVDCFDKISKIAFPEQSTEYSDDEYTVCDVENVTGRRNPFRIASMLGVAAVLAICLFFLPENTGFLNNVFTNGEKTDKEAFREIIAEIKAETENGDYFYYDCTLSEFIDNDVLILPLEGAPFAESKKDGINVRVFVKMCGDIPTNQVYAVEYDGEYDESNYIAAAESKAKFTDNELSRFLTGESSMSDSEADTAEIVFPDTDIMTCSAAGNAFDKSADNLLASDNGKNISAASFSYNCIYKYGDSIYGLANSILYYRENDNEDNDYYYDIISLYDENGEIKEFDNTVFEDSWKNAVYYNGTPAFTEIEKSNFNRIDLINGNEESTDKIGYILPYDYWYEAKNTYSYIVSRQYNYSSEGIDMKLASPLLCNSFMIYYPTVYNSVYLSCPEDSEGKSLNVKVHASYENSQGSFEVPMKNPEPFKKHSGCL